MQNELGIPIWLKVLRAVCRMATKDQYTLLGYFECLLAKKSTTYHGVEILNNGVKFNGQMQIRR